MDVKKEYFRLKDWSMHSEGVEREQAEAALDAFFEQLTEEEKQEVFCAIDQDFASLRHKVEEAHKLDEQITLRKQMEAVLPLISVSALSKKYFGRSSSWFYQRLNGNMVHGVAVSFSSDELKVLADSLADLSELLSEVSTSIRRTER